MYIYMYKVAGGRERERERERESALLEATTDCSHRLFACRVFCTLSGNFLCASNSCSSFPLLCVCVCVCVCVCMCTSSFVD